MRRITFTIIILTATAAQATSNVKPIALHPENPHYFLFRGKPTVLITSAEHYGAVLNLDFDYVTYLNELRKYGFNLTRIFSGDYAEGPGFFNYPTTQPLVPPSGRLIAPWARSSTPGYAGGGNRFNLNAWDTNYFNRLKDFITQAGNGN